jgi:hypothetical protein
MRQPGREGVKLGWDELCRRVNMVVAPFIGTGKEEMDKR